MFKCYNCGAEDSIKQIICKKCSLLSRDEFNFFELFALEKKYQINDIDNKYLKLQQIIHPDNFHNKPPAEKDLALKFSSLVNEAYKILKDERKRAEYLLSLEKIYINAENDNIKPNEELLLEIFLTREDVEEANKIEKLLLLQSKNGEKCNNIFQLFQTEYAQNNLQEAAQAIIHVRYLEKIEDEIVNKIMALKNESNSNI